MPKHSGEYFKEAREIDSFNRAHLLFSDDRSHGDEHAAQAADTVWRRMFPRVPLGRNRVRGTDSQIEAYLAAVYAETDRLHQAEGREYEEHGVARIGNPARYTPDEAYEREARAHDAVWKTRVAMEAAIEAHAAARVALALASRDREDAARG
jgi:hypothetical protein